ncbi:MAG: flavodoxin family protein [Desulfovibrionaceae bacterium]|nr:flavodoxin family protein [Desulfovibrionaceae bacterium]MBF0514405.1 flavodoxin family protein [Desulfovibrionaceae bacterium]
MDSAAGPVVFACSPRGGGNTDRACALFAEGVAQAGGRARIVYLRDYALVPCLGCRKCAVSPGNACVLAARDDCERLFRLIGEAPLAVFCSPVYFYHLPAGFKALIDRAQRFYELRRTLAALYPEREEPGLAPARVVLVAGRPRGEKLFAGSLLTLTYFLKCFLLEPAEPLTLRGLDEPGDLAANLDAAEAVRAYGRLSMTELARR